jgi:hypothetical protein
MPRHTRKEALKALGLKHPLVYEQAVHASSTTKPLRHTGWTTRMLVEAVCDLSNEQGICLVAPNQAMLDEYQSVVLDYCDQLGIDIDDVEWIITAKEADFVTAFDKDKQFVNDTEMNAYRVYYDHWRGSADVRTMGPYGEIRTVHRRSLRAFDYDGDFLLTLTWEGLQELLIEYGSRIIVVEEDTVQQTAFPTNRHPTEDELDSLVAGLSDGRVAPPPGSTGGDADRIVDALSSGPGVAPSVTLCGKRGPDDDDDDSDDGDDDSDDDALMALLDL